MGWCNYRIIENTTIKNRRERESGMVRHFCILAFVFGWGKELRVWGRFGKGLGDGSIFWTWELGPAWKHCTQTLSTCGASCIPYKEVQLPWATMIQQIQQKPVKPDWAVNLTIWLVHSLATVLFLWTQHRAPIYYCVLKNCQAGNLRAQSGAPLSLKIEKRVSPEQN